MNQPTEGAQDARYIVQWICGMLAIGSLLTLGVIAFLSPPYVLVVHFKRGSLLGLIVVFMTSVLTWLLLWTVGARRRSQQHD